MSEKSFNAVVAVSVAAAIVISVVMLNGAALGIEPVERYSAGKAGYAGDYAAFLFDQSRVHTIDIELEDFHTWIKTATDEQYTAAKITVDGEEYHNVGFRVKGNASLLAVNMMASERYSFKLEFDRFVPQTCHGLDKLCLNDLVQDTTYMKELVAYELMRCAGAPSPLTSYVFVTVNGEDFGLYQAVEGIEESFIVRNYGSERGKLYKPDNLSITDFGIGMNFNIFKFINYLLGKIKFSDLGNTDLSSLGEIDISQYRGMTADEFLEAIGLTAETLESCEGDGASSSVSEVEGFNFAAYGNDFLIPDDDVLLKYIDDQPSSYPNIFDNAVFDAAYKDEARLINALRKLRDREDLESTIDTDSVIRYFAAHDLIVNSDGYTGLSVHNYYLREYGGRLSLIPWDYNLCCGTLLMTEHYAVNDPIDEPMAVKSDGNHPMFEWITESEEYRAQYHERLCELTENFDYLKLIESTRELITPYIERDPTKFVTMEEFYAGTEELIHYLDLRFASVRNQLDGNIPTTKAGQLGEPEKKIETDDLNLNKMGDVTMGYADYRRDLSSLDDLRS